MTFSWGLENRAASVSIPHSVLLERRGGYEDRWGTCSQCPASLGCSTSTETHLAVEV